jgi:hypothetical protein
MSIQMRHAKQKAPMLGVAATQDIIKSKQYATQAAKIGVCGLFGVILACSAIQASEPTFDDLLAQARAQSAAGHRYAPAGDNVSETVVTMFKLVPKATPFQISEFFRFLDRDNETTGPMLAINTPSAPVVSPVVPPQAVFYKQPLANIAEPAMRDQRLQPKQEVTTTSVQPQVTTPIATVSHAHAADLFTRGQEAEAQGDFSGARRFYTGAATLGHAAAARSLGRLYDPAYLNQAKLGGIDANPAEAGHWYALAASLGDALLPRG